MYVYIYIYTCICIPCSVLHIINNEITNIYIYIYIHNQAGSGGREGPDSGSAARPARSCPQPAEQEDSSYGHLTIISIHYNFHVIASNSIDEGLFCILFAVLCVC